MQRSALTIRSKYIQIYKSCFVRADRVAEVAATKKSRIKAVNGNNNSFHIILK